MTHRIDLALLVVAGAGAGAGCRSSAGPAAPAAAPVAPAPATSSTAAAPAPAPSPADGSSAEGRAAAAGEVARGTPPRDPAPPGVEVRTEGPYEVWIRTEERGRTTLTCWSTSRDDHASGFCGARPRWTLHFHQVTIQGSDQPRHLRVALRHALEPGLRACQDAAPEVTGTAEMSAAIRADGSLAGVTVSGLGDERLEACLAAAARTARVARALPADTAAARWQVTLSRPDRAGAAP
ncbi:MAG TPA: hypothetical protein VKZ63_00760 [Kofleriaceae bacterium]|nr:hypothetical protein [Kofleriaceae bacterium]